MIDRLAAVSHSCASIVVIYDWTIAPEPRLSRIMGTILVESRKMPLKLYYVFYGFVTWNLDTEGLKGIGTNMFTKSFTAFHFTIILGILMINRIKFYYENPENSILNNYTILIKIWFSLINN